MHFSSYSTQSTKFRIRGKLGKEGKGCVIYPSEKKTLKPHHYSKQLLSTHNFPREYFQSSAFIKSSASEPKREALEITKVRNN